MTRKRGGGNDCKFKIDDLIHDGEIYDYVNNFDYDLEFYRSWCDKASGPCLELCSGTGRLTIPLAAAGIDITGVDYTASMLKRAEEKARAQKLNIAFIRQDIRELELGLPARKFSLVFIPFNSLQCIYSLDDLERIFSRIKAHMAKDAILIIDIFNPNIRLMVDRSTGWREFANFETRDGRKIVITEQCHYDAASEINRVKWKHSLDGEETIRSLDMRCFWPLEMDAILKYNGFEIVHKFGDYDESIFSSDSSKQIYVLKARELS